MWAHACVCMWVSARARTSAPSRILVQVCMKVRMHDDVALVHNFWCVCMRAPISHLLPLPSCMHACVSHLRRVGTVGIKPRRRR